MSALLPPNATNVERAVSLATERAAEIEAPADLMWDPDRIPAAFLPWLAWGLSVDHWDADWSEAAMRAAVRTAVARHRIKGTRRSIQFALAEIGHGSAVIVEDRDLPRYGSDEVYGTAWTYLEDPSWADYRVIVTSPITRDEAERIERRLALAAPARCRLRNISLSQQFYVYSAAASGPWVYGTAVTYGGIYTFGA